MVLNAENHWIGTGDESILFHNLSQKDQVDKQEEEETQDTRQEIRDTRQEEGKEGMLTS